MAAVGPGDYIGFASEGHVAEEGFQRWQVAVQACLPQDRLIEPIALCDHRQQMAKRLQLTFDDRHVLV